MIVSASFWNRPAEQQIVAVVAEPDAKSQLAAPSEAVVALTDEAVHHEAIDDTEQHYAFYIQFSTFSAVIRTAHFKNCQTPYRWITRKNVYEIGVSFVCRICVCESVEVLTTFN